MNKFIKWLKRDAPRVDPVDIVVEPIEKELIEKELIVAEPVLTIIQSLKFIDDWERKPVIGYEDHKCYGYIYKHLKTGLTLRRDYIPYSGDSFLEPAFTEDEKVAILVALKSYDNLFKARLKEVKAKEALVRRNEFNALLDHYPHD